MFVIEAASRYLPLAGGTLTGGLTGPSYAYSTAQERSVSLPAPAFSPADPSDSDVNYLRRHHNRLYYSSTALTPGGRSVTLDAPLNVPHGAQLTALICYYRQGRGNPTTVSIAADLFRVSNISTSDAASLASLANTSTTAKAYVTAVTGAVSGTQLVDLDSNFYTVRATFAATGVLSNSEAMDQAFDGCRVTYTVASPD